MNYNICLVQPNGYIHSAAFVELAELVGHGLRDLGHAAVINVNHTFVDARNIVIGCHLLDPSYIPKIPKDSVIINTEQVAADDTAWNSTIFKWVSSFETWDYSDRNLSKLNEIGAKNPKLLRLGYHPELARIPKAAAQDIDVLFYGSINERRKKVIDSLKATGLNVQTVFGVYGDERDKLISRSKVVLNLHFYNSQIFEVVRVFYLMTNAKAVVGEAGPNTSIDEAYARGIHIGDYDGLVQACVSVAANDDMRRALEEQALAAIQELPQSALLRPLIE